MSESSDDQPSDTMRGRVSGSRVRLWVLIGANRHLLTGILLAGVFSVLAVLGWLDPFPLGRTISNYNTISLAFQGFLTTIITAVTLVVTINQVVLSQELGPVGDQRERMEEAMSFRQDIENDLDIPVSPPEPASFLRALIELTETRAEDLRSAVSDSRDERFRVRVDEYADSLVEHSDEVSDQLTDAQFGTFEVIFAALNYNYSWKIYEARRLRHEHAEEMTDQAEEEFDRIIEALSFFGPAREHFKTLYFQWELVNLSRVMLYASLPALLVTLGMLYYANDAATIVGTTLGVGNVTWVASGAATVALLPFVLLLSYVLRIATVAKRTLAIGPFVLRETEHTGDIEWE